ncbi:(2,3-dihydroxybenzoyl)adenylate synthase [Rheinheimera riviphila]|nr:AMP-binding protein [Rheinheimera riviphila]
MGHFTQWPTARAALYQQQGAWQDQPLHYWCWQQAHHRPQQIALICRDRQLSYRQLWQAATQLARLWQQQGLQAGQPVLVQLGNCAEFYLVLIACWQAGLVPLNALYRHGRKELREFALQLQPALLVFDSRHPLFSGNQLPDGLADIPQRYCLGSHSLANPLPDFFQPGTILPALSTAADPAPQLQQELALFQLSGGSTGIPKLIPRTHRDYACSVRDSVAVCQWTPQLRYLCALPAGHNFALSSPGALGVFCAGGTLVLAASPEASSCFALIREHQVNWAALVPAAARLWLDAPENLPRPVLEVLQIGGAALSPTLAQALEQQFGCIVQQVYGMAEGLVNYTALTDPPTLRWHYQGRPMSKLDEIRIVNAVGNIVQRGEPGELQTRGPYTICGYWQGGEDSFTADGFYRTGDLVREGPDGLLQVVGRLKDQVNRGGEKFAAAEVETELLKHPAVRQAAVISIPDLLLGEKSLAVLVCDPQRPTPTAVSLRRFLREQGLADFKIPDKVQCSDQLPLTAVGKTDKPALRALYATIFPTIEET